MLMVYALSIFPKSKRHNLETVLPWNMSYRQDDHLALIIDRTL